MRAVVIFPAVLALAACVAEPPEPFMPDTESLCGAGALQTLVGQPASVLETITFAGPTRVLRPGMAATTDYREDRLNIEVDARERIARVACG